MKKQIYHSRITGYDYPTAKERFKYEEQFIQRIMSALLTSFDEAKQQVNFIDVEIFEKDERCEWETNPARIADLEKDIIQLQKDKDKLLKRQHELWKLSEMLY